MHHTASFGRQAIVHHELKAVAETDALRVNRQATTIGVLRTFSLQTLKQPKKSQPTAGHMHPKDGRKRRPSKLGQHGHAEEHETELLNSCRDNVETIDHGRVTTNQHCWPKAANCHVFRPKRPPRFVEVFVGLHKYDGQAITLSMGNATIEM